MGPGHEVNAVVGDAEDGGVAVVLDGRVFVEPKFAIQFFSDCFSGVQLFV